MDTSPYPVSQFIEKIIRNSGYTTYGYALAFGLDGRLEALEAWLRDAEGPDDIITAMARANPEEAAGLRSALAETVEMKAAGVDPLEVERAKAQKSFIPFLFAEGERTVPTQITFFAITGGFNRWAIVSIPESMRELPLEEQLSRLPALMADYRTRHNGQVMFFGRLTGFRLVRYRDQFRFDADGNLLEHVDEPFYLAAAWVELR